MSPEQFDNVLSWAVDLEDEARQQAIRSAALPFVEKPLALMPDAHYGMGATVGSVIATTDAIIPAAVGVDIGCGMIAVRTQFTSNDLPDNLDELHNQISKSIPSGVGRKHDFNSDWDRMRHTRKVPSYDGSTKLSIKQANTITDQLGTLGSGNHFVEVCLDEQDRVWLVLHSGSRGIGNQLAQIHINKAKGLMKQYFIKLSDPDLAYLTQGTPAFDDYIADMLWAQKYAMANRSVMMSAAVEQFGNFLGEPVKPREHINCHHNFTQLEYHHGKNVWLTRKGAIKASKGDKGIIPGSMGTSSYIVSGLGNPASYESCSHGAGRRMSRTRARKELSVDVLREKMAGKSWNEKDAITLLDESPESYKNIDTVMEAQKDLVKIDHTLHSILNYKGL
jgi:tRNA-splicing ligase RtcB (3'-phosphate/5'-hydroxy nucleic acid ligase)